VDDDVEPVPPVLPVERVLLVELLEEVDLLVFFTESYVDCAICMCS
jgi:hypothetical protein